MLRRLQLSLRRTLRFISYLHMLFLSVLTVFCKTVSARLKSRKTFLFQNGAARLQRQHIVLVMAVPSLMFAAGQAHSGDDYITGSFIVSYGTGLSRNCDNGACNVGVQSVVASSSPFTPNGGPVTYYLPAVSVTIGFSHIETFAYMWTPVEGQPGCWFLEMGPDQQIGGCTGVTGATITKTYAVSADMYENASEAVAAAQPYALDEFCGGSVMNPEWVQELLVANGLDLLPYGGPAMPCPGGVGSSTGGFSITSSNFPCYAEGDCSGTPFAASWSSDLVVCCACAPPPEGCPAPKVWNSETCVCECPPTECPEGETLDPETCDCITTDPNTGGPGGPKPGDPPPPPPPGDPGTGGPDPEGPGPDGPDPDGPDGDGPGDPPPPDPDPEDPTPPPDEPDGGDPDTGGPNPPNPCEPRECDPGYHWSPEACACVPDSDPPGDGAEGIIGFCGDASGTCSTEWGFKSLGGGWVSFRAWVRNTKAGAVGSTVGHTQTQHWQVLEIELPWDLVQHWCCWQQTWSINLPESAVDMNLVNSWANKHPQSDRLNANLIKLRNVITQATSIQFDATGWGGDSFGAPSQPYQGYACGVFLYPGPGCQYKESTSTLSMDAIIGELDIATSDMYSSATMKAGDITQTFLGEFNTMMGAVTTSITAGLIKPGTDFVAAFEGSLNAARAEAAGLQDGFFTWTYGKGLFNSGEGNSLDILQEVSTAFGTAVSQEKVVMIRNMLTVFIYLFGLKCVWGMFVPATILPGSGLGSRDRDDD